MPPLYRLPADPIVTIIADFNVNSYRKISFYYENNYPFSTSLRLVKKLQVYYTAKEHRGRSSGAGGRGTETSMLMTRDKHFYGWFFRLTLTIALQNLIVFSVSFADNIMLGAYSQDALSGVALVNQIQFILQMLTMGVGEGIVVLGAQFWGKRDTEPIKRITNCGLRIGLVISLLLWAAVFFFPHFCLSLFTNEERVIAEGMQYLRIICFPTRCLPLPISCCAACAVWRRCESAFSCPCPP